MKTEGTIGKRGLKRFYVDTSAYLTVLTGQEGHQTLIRELAGAEVLSSSLLVLEVHRNLIWMSRSGRISPLALQVAIDRFENDLPQFTLRDLTIDLCQNRLMPVVSTPRSLDLAHLRTAMWFHAQEPLTRFVSLDDAQNLAARELGLPV